MLRSESFAVQQPSLTTFFCSCRILGQDHASISLSKCSLCLLVHRVGSVSFALLPRPADDRWRKRGTGQWREHKRTFGKRDVCTISPLIAADYVLFLLCDSMYFSSLPLLHALDTVLSRSFSVRVPMFCTFWCIAQKQSVQLLQKHTCTKKKGVFRKSYVCCLILVKLRELTFFFLISTAKYSHRTVYRS